MTLKFELGRDILTVYLPTKFHRTVFNHSEVIVLTNKHIYKQTSTSPCYAMLVEKYYV